jgi:hypothetical protein
MDYLLDYILAKRFAKRSIRLAIKEIKDETLKQDLITTAQFLIELDLNMNHITGRTSDLTLAILQKDAEIEKLKKQVEELKELL